ncbi:MAG: UDP-2,4-diacetamido-2,4,6-trideoxy-beta-L-altropyranose hydrolase [Pseudomonadota bacterium]
MKHAVFRVDASQATGGGHLVRCLALAEALAERGWACEFYSTSSTKRFLADKFKAKFEFHFDRSLKEMSSNDLTVFDHYRISKPDEQAIRDQTSCILVIDDLADRPHVCDVLLDQGYGRSRSDYAELVPRGCKFLLGSDFALLGSSFLYYREIAVKRRQKLHDVERILINFGASDPHQVNQRVVKALSTIPIFARIDIVASRYDSGLAELEAAASRLPDASVLTDVDDMAPLMAAADLAFGAPGVSAWERCAVGLPSVLVMTADNQSRNYKNLVGEGAAVGLGRYNEITDASIKGALTDLLMDPTSLQSMSFRAGDLCDGTGTHRVIDAIAPLCQ